MTVVITTMAVRANPRQAAIVMIGCMSFKVHAQKLPEAVLRLFTKQPLLLKNRREFFYSLSLSGEGIRFLNRGEANPGYLYSALPQLGDSICNLQVLLLSQLRAHRKLDRKSTRLNSSHMS